MRERRWFPLGLGLALLLAGCGGLNTAPSPEPAPPPPRVADGDACGAERVQDRIGRAYDAALGEAIRAESGAVSMRVVRPGEAVTLDYRPERLNVRLDEDDVIAEIACG
ncbi:Peptidase inhibitor I78 family protein [Halomonas shengliensis]|uniref:Peptidase inhibitor I78 family protein n=1 Tax=Halomonas shengliensis TaxID=419597 RepID=A0A1H0K4Y6_9GAMM|nr:I78 family peptidase inhibitor [Halomonas shengliensis]SDO51075.1 Peptidase inhibitor I78 family protein [Halomonas shengliensis]